MINNRISKFLIISVFASFILFAPISGVISANGTAIQFNGDGDVYAEARDHDDFSISTTGVLTISAWLRPDVLDFPITRSSSDGPFIYWLGKGNATGNWEWTFRMYNKTNSARPNRISFYVFNPKGGIGVGSYFQDTITTDEWMRIAAKVDNHKTYIYKNG